MGIEPAFLGCFHGFRWFCSFWCFHLFKPWMQADIGVLGWIDDDQFDGWGLPSNAELPYFSGGDAEVCFMDVSWMSSIKNLGSKDCGYNRDKWGQSTFNWGYNPLTKWDEPPSRIYRYIHLVDWCSWSGARSFLEQDQSYYKFQISESNRLLVSFISS